jgi:hypothetical protein
VSRRRSTGRGAGPRAWRSWGWAVLAVAVLPGCGWLTLVHDTMLGPVSPAGRIHDVTVGSNFHVTDTGPVADARGEPLFRPYPEDLIERLGAPHSLWSLTQGIEAAIAGFSPVVQRDASEQQLPAAEARAGLRPGLDVTEVLRRLGPPELWIRRPQESLMLYRGRDRRTWAFYLGIPPPASALLPVPGLSSLRFRYTSVDERVEKLLLFFDERDRLRAVSESGPEVSAP